MTNRIITNRSIYKIYSMTCLSVVLSVINCFTLVFIVESIIFSSSVFANSTQVVNSEVQKKNTEVQGRFMHPRDFFKSLSKKSKQLWVVGYVNGTVEDSIKDLELSFANGADAIVFESSDYKKLDETLAQIRKKFPKSVIGVNFLGPDEKLFTYKETFELALKHQAQIAWTDFSGVDQINEAHDENLQNIEALKPSNVFYVSGIHMKYSTLKNPLKPIEKSALQAMGWVDGIVITGPKTGIATDPDRAQKVRAVIGDYPMGAASGVSAENIKSILSSIDFVLVNSSISEKSHRIIGEKVKALRAAMDSK